MKSPTRRVTACVLQLLCETRGQDLIEYALMASLVAIAAGAVMPPVTNNISVIFSKVTSLARAATSN